MLSVTRPMRTYCSHAHDMLIKSQRIKPGLSSLNDLISNDGKKGGVGFSGRPMKNCNIRACISACKEYARHR